jgi:NAD(P)-dependent dehydrogenase (short-subunit alcohol dehydrogenase family)
MSQRKAVIVGASGNIGREIVAALDSDYDIVRVGRRSGDIQCDYTEEGSVREMLSTVDSFDALICVAGRDSAFKPYRELNDDDFRYGFERKLLAQLRLVRLGERHIRDKGSFTLSSGFLSHYPNPASAATGPFNAAVDAFVESVAPLLERGVRLNVVSPAPVVAPDRAGRGAITAPQAAQAYIQAIEGDFTGRVIRPWGGLPEPSPLQ